MKSRQRFVRTLSVLMVLMISLFTLSSCEEEVDFDEAISSGVLMVADKGSGTLEITRATPGATKPASVEDDTWTVFVYLCGSDLESEGGAATQDLSEMVGGMGSEAVSFVVETGGARKWQGDVKSNRTGRFLIQDGSIMDVGTTKEANMGETETLGDFLTWGIENYPADHMGVILWDHGGGSISGVCFDERHDDDSLALLELDQAFSSVLPHMWDKFDFVGFDACLMGTLEASNVLATYADYMIASEEYEPGTGWEYSSIIEYLAQHPGCDGGELGKSLCDSYLASLDESDKSFATLSVVDLSQVDGLLQDFYHFSQELYSSSEKSDALTLISRGMRSAENFGGNTWLEGYSNMVDVGDMAKTCKSFAPSANEVTAAVDKAVTYQICGPDHKDATGLSLYYPLSIEDADELSVFQSVCVNPSYLAYVDRSAQGATYGTSSDEYEDYSDDEWFDEDGLWSWLFGSEEDQDTQEHWSYLDEHTDESSLISFADEPQLDDEGTYWFCLDEDGLDNTVGVSALVYTIGIDDDVLALGETYDVYGDWDTGEVEDGFDGKWLSLPDGQNLCVYVVDYDEDDYITYTSPIKLNGEETYLRLRQHLDSDKVTVEGTWDGVEESGEVGRGITPLEKGDVIASLYDAFTTDDEEITYEGIDYKLTSNKLKVTYDYLYEGTYLYSFCIEDIFGDYFITDSVEFVIDEAGDITFSA